jgi:hypothetical protein
VSRRVMIFDHASTHCSWSDSLTLAVTESDTRSSERDAMYHTEQWARCKCNATIRLSTFPSRLLWPRWYPLGEPRDQNAIKTVVLYYCASTIILCGNPYTVVSTHAHRT